MSSGISETEADSSLSCTAKSPRQPKHPQPLQEVHYENISYLDPAQHELSIKVINLV